MARKVIRKRIRHDKDGVHVVGDIDAVISTNVGRGGQASSVSSRQRIVQRSTARADSRQKGSPPDEQEDDQAEHGTDQQDS